MEGLRSASGFEGLIVLGVIYFILNLISRAKRGTRPGESSAEPRVTTSPTGAPSEAASLESILRQIEAVKQQKGRAQPGLRPPPQARSAPQINSRPAPPKLREAAQDDRGPLGRTSRTRLDPAEEIEDRTSLEDEGALVAERRLRNIEVFEERPGRVVEDRDEAAAMIAQRRIDLAEARNRPHAAPDHAAFDQEIRKPEQPAPSRQRPTLANLREAMIWREILGPPKALQDE